MIQRIKSLISLRDNRGMTLIEIMIVLAIIAILGAIVVPRFMDMPQKARVTAAKNQIQNFSLAIEKYYFDTGRYPAEEEGLQVLKKEGYMKKIPKDPWGNPYHYRYPGEHNTDSYDLWSNGADGQEGGEGFDADISNWE
jgi:general secretion pathway protein G